MNRVDAIGIKALLRSTAAAPRRTLWRLLMLAALLPVSAQAGFDHSHAAWTASLSAQGVPTSIGCPMLREEAFVAERIDAQLDDQAAERFMSDRSRNRYNAATGRLEVLKIFDWYADDFKRDHKGIVSALAFYARCAVRLSDVPTGQEEIRAQNASVSYLDPGLRLNDVRR